MVGLAVEEAVAEPVGIGVDVAVPVWVGVAVSVEVGVEVRTPAHITIGLALFCGLAGEISAKSPALLSES